MDEKRTEMKKSIKKIWSYWRVFSFVTNYETCPVHSLIIKRCLDSGIKSVTWNYNTGTKTHATVTVSFGNGVTSELWNENFPYAWLSRNRFEMGGHYSEDFNESMPDLKQRVRLYLELQKYPKHKPIKESRILSLI